MSRSTRNVIVGFLLASAIVPAIALAARTSIEWVNLSGTTYIQPNFGLAGMDLLVVGSNHYINFNTVTGSSGYGLRDNGGVMEFKNSGGSWTGIGTGGGGGGLATSTVDYIVSTQGGVVSALKTSSNTILSSSASADVVLNAVVADAPTTGASISVKPGTYYLNATTTFAGTTDLKGSTWKLEGAGQGSTNFVVNGSADAFFFLGTVKGLFNDFTIYLKDGANGFTASSTSGFRSLWNSQIQNITITGTTSLSTGWGFNLVNDDHSIFSNLYIQNVGNCFRSATDILNKFNPGDATLSDIHCTFNAPSGSPVTSNTYTGGIGYFFDGSATATLVNQDTLINVLAFDGDGTRTGFRFNHVKNIRGVSVEAEGFATTSEAYNSQFLNLNWEYVIGSSVATNVYFYNNSTSKNNVYGCSYTDSYAGAQPLFIDQSVDATNPNILQGIGEGVCQLQGSGSFTFSTSSTSIIRHVQGGPIGSFYNSVLGLASRLWVGTTTPLSATNLEVQGNSATTYAANAFSGLRMVVANTNQTNNNFADIDLDMYSTTNNGLITGTRLMSIFTNHVSSLTDFAIVNGSREVARFSSGGNVGFGTTTPLWLLTAASSTGPQIGLTDTTSGDNAWTLRSINNNLYIATSTAVSTSTVAALSLDSNGFLYNPVISASSGSFCLQVDTTGKITNTGSACSSITTPISIANGGTATSTMYAGGVLFYDGTLGTVSQSGTQGKLYWDRTNNRLALGTTSPQTPFHLWQTDSNTTITTGNADAIRITNANTTDNSMGEVAFSSVDSTNAAELRTSGVFGITTSHTNGAMSGALAFVTRNAGTFAERVRITPAGSVGVGTTTPWAALSVVSAGSATQPLFAVATSTGASASSTQPIFMIDGSYHVITGGPQPTFSACGTAPTITGNDNVMRINTGTAGLTECIVNFAKSWNLAPVCTVDEEGTTATVTLIASTSVSQLRIGLSTSLTGASIGVQCMGLQ